MQNPFQRVLEALGRHRRAAELARSLASARELDLLPSELGPDAMLGAPKGRPPLLDFGLKRWNLYLARRGRRGGRGA